MRSQVTISKNNIVTISLKIEFVLANSADPYEMLRSVASSSSGSSLFAKVPILWPPVS